MERLGGELITVKDLARQLGKTEHTIWAWARKDYPQGVWLQIGGQWHARQRLVNAWLDGTWTPGDPVPWTAPSGTERPQRVGGRPFAVRPQRRRFPRVLGRRVA